MLIKNLKVNIEKVSDGEEDLDELLAELLVLFINEKKGYSYVELR